MNRRRKKIINKLIFFTLANNFIYRERFFAFRQREASKKKKLALDRELRRRRDVRKMNFHTRIFLFLSTIDGGRINKESFLRITHNQLLSVPKVENFELLTSV